MNDALDDSDDDWVEIARFGARREFQQYALVLTAVGIDYQLIEADGGVALLVASPDVVPARRELAAFARENRRPYPSRAPEPELRDGVPAALIYCAVLVALFAVSRRQGFSQEWFSAGALQAGLIAEGEWWRVVTALGLHADIAHLFANLFMGAVFGIFLAQILGAGLGWLTILAAGGLGNWLNALVQPVTHTAVGASTAVFAAIGILAVLNLKPQASLWKKGFRRWLPLAAGVALLSFLGFSGVRTDFGAHVAGFIAGSAFGAGLLLTAPAIPRAWNVQVLFGGSALVLFAGSWLWAFGAAGP